MQVRPASHDDADDVAALVHSAYRGEESRQGWTTEADLVSGQRADASMVRALVDAPEAVVLVTGSPGSLIGCCHLDRRGFAAYLGMFAVRPDRQGHGLGRELLEAAGEYARSAWGAERLEITVLSHRPELIAWYERRGFVLTGERHPFPDGDERFGMPRRADLALLGMARELSSDR